MHTNGTPTSQHARRPLTRRTVLRRTAVGGLALAGGAAVAGPLVAGADAATPEFGYRDDGRAYVVGTGADLVFKVDHRNGDLTSLVYRGTEYQRATAAGTRASRRASARRP
ncbi:hypothetical protein GCM10010234_16230 [Streptomyces hawaiiensis]